jgi:hypothetical protein
MAVLKVSWCGIISSSSLAEDDDMLEAFELGGELLARGRACHYELSLGVLKDTYDCSWC